jgi:peptidoglycan hydrolase FlgJ
VNAIDTGSMYLQNQALKAPTAIANSAKGAITKGIDKSSDLYKQCQDFEAIFVKMMLSSMKDTINKSSLTEEAPGQAIYEDMLYDEYASQMTKTANFGLADQMYSELAGLSR